MELRKTDSKGRIVLPKSLRQDKISIMKIGNRGLIVPVKDPYESLNGKLSAPPLEEMRKGTEKRLLEEARKGAE